MIFITDFPAYFAVYSAYVSIQSALRFSQQEICKCWSDLKEKKAKRKKSSG